MLRTDILDRESEIKQWIAELLPNAEIARRLCCKVDTLKSYYKKMGIEYSGNQNRKGMIHKELRISIELFLSGNASNSAKRKRLVEEGIKEEKCECCKRSEWMGKPIPLELHHKDFNHFNNSLDNLLILCSNCHALVHNYNNTVDKDFYKNLSASREILEVESRKFGEALTEIADGNPEPSSLNREGVETIHEKPKSE